VAVLLLHFEMALKYIPDADAMREAADVQVFDIKGNEVRLGSLFEHQKVVLVFIRKCCGR
jgi:mRNA-degrading endonuclease HigB of HigAB toxin-antitoxin module